MRSPKVLFILIGLIVAPLVGGVCTGALSFGLFPFVVDMDASQYEIVDSAYRDARGDAAAGNLFLSVVYGILFLVTVLIPLSSHWSRKGTYSASRFSVAGLLATGALYSLAYFTTADPTGEEVLTGVSASLGAGFCSALTYWMVTRARTSATPADGA